MRKTGRMVPCCVCGTLHYRPGHYLRRAHKRMVCRNPECLSKSFMGENNPFWGKIHNEATKERLRISRKSRPAHKNKGPKGYKHTPEARAKITAALKQRWLENRDKMLKSLSHLKRDFRAETARYRKNFTPYQRKAWKKDSCAWCNSKSKLILDHIIPVMCGGGNLIDNAQTLCQPCNLWKMAHVDRPLFKAGLVQYRG